MQALYDVINYNGAAEAMSFHGDEKADDTTESGIARTTKKSVLRSVNGFFFTLFVMRVPLVVASALFGVQETTGGRAFRTWVRFLRGALNPFVRLPSVDDVLTNAPDDFKAKGMSKVVLVLNAVKVETEQVWVPDLAYVLWSTDKHRPTGKLVIAVTPSGFICHMSNMYGGRLSAPEIVRKSGLIDGLGCKGFAHGEFKIMADGGFDPLTLDLAESGLEFVVPPSRRAKQGELQFLDADAGPTEGTADMRVNVDRAIGALKEWRILDTKFSTNQLDIMPTLFRVCGALVNMSSTRFHHHVLEVHRCFRYINWSTGCFLTPSCRMSPISGDRLCCRLGSHLQCFVGGLYLSFFFFFFGVGACYPRLMRVSPRLLFMAALARDALYRRKDVYFLLF